MSILSILAYVGIGLGSAIAMLFLNCALGRTKVHYIVGDKMYDGSRGSFIAAYAISILELTVIAAWMLLSVFQLSMLKSIGVSVVVSLLMLFVIMILSSIICHYLKIESDERDGTFHVDLVIACITNGALLAVILAHLGIF